MVVQEKQQHKKSIPDKLNVERCST